VVNGRRIAGDLGSLLLMVHHQGATGAAVSSQVSWSACLCDQGQLHAVIAEVAYVGRDYNSGLAADVRMRTLVLVLPACSVY
jgi:hypothetical protein